MKSVKAAVIIVLVSFLADSMASAEHHEASVEKGKALFNEPKLGTTGKSCNDCHPGGQGIEQAADKKDLEVIVNGCITNGLKGKALDIKSIEMESMVKYIKSLGEGKTQHSKQAPRGY